MKKISVSSRYNLMQICEKHAAGYKPVSCKIGFDDRVYVLLSAKIPERIRGMFVNTEANTDYCMIVITVNWDNGEIIHEESFKLGKHRMNFHFIQPLVDNILLLGARTYNHPEGPEKNAVIVDRNGNTVREMCFGDGIEDCITTGDGKIFVSYFDEGVFGNYGWDKPIGSCGLIVFDENGEIQWKCSRRIYDCYAINTDNKGNLWYYYYDEFKIVKSDLVSEKEYDPQVEGSSFFMISGDMQSLLINGGYDDPIKLITAKIKEDGLSDFDEVSVYFNENAVLLIRPMCSFGSKVIFADNIGNVYFKMINSIE